MTTALALDRNEYYFEHCPLVREALKQSELAVNRYASRNAQVNLTHALANLTGTEAGSITLCHGAEDGLVKLLSWQRRFAGVLWVSDFSWPNYLHIADGLDFKVETFYTEAELECTSTSLAHLSSALAKVNSKCVVLLASPNNPTGHGLSIAQFEKIVSSYPQHSFILDGVYDTIQTEFVKLPAKFSNCFFVGSFSKYFGMPGLRVGYVIGDAPKGFDLALGLQPSAIAAATAALNSLPYYDKNRKIMQVFAKEMQKFSCAYFEVMPSEAPFVLIKFQNKTSLVKNLREIFESCERHSGVRPKYFTRNNCQFIRWGLGPQEINTCIKTYMQALIIRLSPATAT